MVMAKETMPILSKFILRITGRMTTENQLGVADPRRKVEDPQPEI